jgi:hypothetical protein
VQINIKAPLKRSLQRLVYFLPALGWALLIASLSTTTALPPIPWDFLAPDKIGHLVFYALLTGWLFFGMAGKQWRRLQLSNSVLFLAVLIASMYGAFLELVQAQLPHRQFDYADMIANCLGALLAFGSYRCACWRWLSKE